MSAVLSSCFGAGQQFFNNQGVILSGGLIYTYMSGTTTPVPTYTDSTSATPNPNPLVIGSNGRLPNEVWIANSTSVKFILCDANNNILQTQDYVPGINSTNLILSEWVPGLTATYIGASSFSVVGNNVATYQVNRRIQYTVTSGTYYGTISASVYGSVTTVTFAADSTGMDSSLSAVNYGFMSAVNQSIPAIFASTVSANVWLSTQNFTGSTITVPTASVGDNTTKPASTAFTTAAIAAQAFSTALPAQGGNAGKFVTTDGTTASWVMSLPSAPATSLYAGTAAAGVAQAVTLGPSLSIAGGVLSAGIMNVFGDGSDGNVTVSGAITLSRDMFYNNLTLNSACAINTAGYRIFVAGTLDISAAPAGAIYWNGNNALTGGSNFANGAALASTNLGGGSAGGQGGGSYNGGSSLRNGTNGTAGAQGGNSAIAGASTGTNGTPGTAISNTFIGTSLLSSPIGLTISGTTLSASLAGAGGSGGGGSVGANGYGGGGGGGAGVIVISANIVARGTNATAAIIQAKGGLGGIANNGAGGGSGGGGGWVLILFEVLTGSTIANAIDISGGAGGAGAYASGTVGNGGGSGGSGTLEMLNVGAGTVVVTNSINGSSGTAGSGTTPGAGATATTKQVNL